LSKQLFVSIFTAKRNTSTERKKKRKYNSGANGVVCSYCMKECNMLLLFINNI